MPGALLGPEGPGTVTGAGRVRVARSGRGGGVRGLLRVASEGHIGRYRLLEGFAPWVGWVSVSGVLR